MPIFSFFSETDRLTITKILRKVERIMATQEDAAAELTTIKEQLVKANTEIQQKIADLIAAAANTDVQPALQSAIDALKPAAQALDDVVPG